MQDIQHIQGSSLDINKNIDLSNDENGNKEQIPYPRVGVRQVFPQVYIYKICLLYTSPSPRD